MNIKKQELVCIDLPLHDDDIWKEDEEEEEKDNEEKKKEEEEEVYVTNKYKCITGQPS